MLERLRTRSRIVWLVIGSALPIILLCVYVALQQRGAAEVRARDEIRHHAQVVAALLRGAPVDELPAADAIGLGRGELVSVIDASGAVMARYPPRLGAPGEALSDRAVLDIIASKHGTIVESRDGAGMLRLYVSKAVETPQGQIRPMTVLVSVPKSIIHEDVDRALTQTLAGIAVVTLVLIVSAWYGADRLVLRPIRTLLDMAAKVRAGDFSARSGLTRSPEELSQLGAALDDMANQLEARDAKLREVLRELREQAITDPLTGLYNRRYLWDALMREVRSMQRKRATFSIILMDLDHFKTINDTWGHEAGDVALKAVADVVRHNIRGSDIAARYGGEEFAFLLPETTAGVAEERAQALRKSLESTTIQFGEKSMYVTASFGVVEYDRRAADAHALMKSVDNALYAAKQSGRNKVVVGAAAAT